MSFWGGYWGGNPSDKDPTLLVYLPTGEAFRAPEGSKFRAWLAGMDPTFDAMRYQAVAKTWGEWSPASATLLDQWEDEEGLRRSTTLTDQERRDRIVARRAEEQALGPDVIEGKLQAAGFAVYLHAPRYVHALGHTAVRNPGEYLLPAYGGNDADGHLIKGAYLERADVYKLWSAGEFSAGEVQVGDGRIDIETNPLQYTPDPLTHPHYAYLGGQTFPDTVDIAVERREEFEDLVLQVIGAHLFAVLRVRYV